MDYCQMVSYGKLEYPANDEKSFEDNVTRSDTIHERDGHLAEWTDGQTDEQIPHKNIGRAYRTAKITWSEKIKDVCREKLLNRTVSVVIIVIIVGRSSN